MFELLVLAIFIWLFVKSVGLALRLTWGAAKLIASVLLALAMPALVLCMVFAGGLMLLIPIGIIAIAAAILKSCL